MCLSCPPIDLLRDSDFFDANEIVDARMLVSDPRISESEFGVVSIVSAILEASRDGLSME